MDIKDLEHEYTAAQIETVAKLQKKVAELEDKNKSLLMMLEGTVPSLELTPSNLGISNEQIVCITQIARLKAKAIGSEELTMEDARKLQIYVDVLEKITKESDQDDHSDIPEAQLLEMVKT